MVVWMHIYGAALTLPGLFCINIHFGCLCADVCMFAAFA